MNPPRIHSDWFNLLPAYVRSESLFGVTSSSAGYFVNSKLGKSPHDSTSHRLYSAKVFSTSEEAHVEWCRLFRSTDAWEILMEAYDYWYASGVFRLCEPGYVPASSRENCGFPTTVSLFSNNCFTVYQQLFLQHICSVEKTTDFQTLFHFFYSLLNNDFSTCVFHCFFNNCSLPDFCVKTTYL